MPTKTITAPLQEGIEVWMGVLKTPLQRETLYARLVPRLRVYKSILYRSMPQ